MHSWQRRGRRPAPVWASLFLIFTPFVSAVWPFSQRRYTSNSLVDGGSLGLADLDGRIVAFGDLDGDQYMDIVTLSADQRTLSVYLWNHNNYVFSRNQAVILPNDILNVIPGDFDRDGRLDLLVMTRSTSGSWWDSEQNAMSVYLGVGNGQLSTTPISVPSSTLSQPIPLDSTGELRLDLLGYVPATSSITSPTLQLWHNVWNSSDLSSAMFDLSTPPLDTSRACSLSNPHSGAIVDLDGDCLADLFLVCDTPSSSRKTYQIWLNSKENGYVFAREGLLPDGAGPITFTDMDRDGTVDLIFPTCSSISSTTGVGTDCAINIAYNRQLPLCAVTSSFVYQKALGPCRRPDDLCSSDPNFTFSLENWQDNDYFSHIPLSTLSPNHPTSLLLFDHTFNPALPVPLRVADLSLSGFPSILPVLVNATAGGFMGIGAQISTTAEILESVPCLGSMAGCEGGKTLAGRRGFRPVTEGTAALAAITDVRGVTVLDLDEDGTLDILVQRTGSQSGSNGAKVTFVQNNFFHDAFFLKAIVLNGACKGSWCYPSNGARYQPFGTSYSGASYKYTILDTSGKRSAAQVGQLPQTSYHALHTPYSFFGLGRTNNYVENLFVGSTMHSNVHFINLEGVIPNSKVVINPSTDNSEWHRELFLRPGEWIPWVTLTAIVATAVLAAIVLVLHINENREDERERRRALHHINFDAL